MAPTSKKQKVNASKDAPDVLMVGTGEYTTGFVHGKGSGSDKKVGVVALCMFDMKSEHRGAKVNNLKMVGTTGTKFPGIREHFKRNIQEVYSDIDISFESFPSDDVERDHKAYLKALDTMKEGDIVTIVTPDDTHFEIAKAAIQKGLHVLVTKPPVKKLKEQIELLSLAEKHNVLVGVEYHKRWDPIYSDARERIRQYGDFSYFTSYMSQPKSQLDTFRSWAGKSSDISYYLNSHHIDFHCWAMQGIAIPISVAGMMSTGVAKGDPYNLPENTEDTITLMVQWRNIKSGNLAHATYTSSWIASKSDVHSQQRFFYMGHHGELNVDQAHRGYIECTDPKGIASINPLYMKYTKDSKGRFSGQGGYGYKSIEAFVDAVGNWKDGKSKVQEFDDELATISATLTSTAILEAGRMSLDNNSRQVTIQYDAKSFVPSSLELRQ